MKRNVKRKTGRSGEGVYVSAQRGLDSVPAPRPITGKILYYLLPERIM
jgi:hypothetical protein